MELTKKDIQHIASLARLALTPNEEDQFSAQLSSILEYVSQLQEVDNTLPDDYQYPVEGLKNIMDTDEVRECDEETRKRIIDSFPQRVGDLLKVKGIFHE